MTSLWAEEVAARLDEAAEMIEAFGFGSPDEVARLGSAASVLRRAAVTLGAEESHRWRRHFVDTDPAPSSAGQNDVGPEGWWGQFGKSGAGSHPLRLAGISL